MLAKMKPSLLELPDEYSILVEPGKAVRVGSKVHIKITYQNGDYDKHQPILEMLREPTSYPEKPQEYGELIARGKSPTFEFLAESPGMYVLRLRPFLRIPGGELIEIHSINEQEEAQIAPLLQRIKDCLKF